MVEVSLMEGRSLSRVRLFWEHPEKKVNLSSEMGVNLK